MSNDTGQFDLFQSVNLPAVEPPIAPASMPEEPIGQATAIKAARKIATAKAFVVPPAPASIVPFIGVRDVAKRYSVSVPTIWRWLSLGKFPSPYRIGAGSTRWAVTDLDTHDLQLMPGQQK